MNATVKRLFVYFQYLAPQQQLSVLMGWLAESRHPQVKRFLIERFVKTYPVDMSIAKESDLSAYPSFNSFFTRELKEGSRVIAQEPNGVVSPADGTIAQIGIMSDKQLLQAKGVYYNLDALLANDMSAEWFEGGAYATIYLAPHNYHRVHMPFTGKLIKSLYVPGKLFSVNILTSTHIPNLYGRNERLITLFETEIGPMAVILVGAMLVGSIQTVWQKQPVRRPALYLEDVPPNLILKKGAELGHFKMGSTVIVLFGRGKVAWAETLAAGQNVQVGDLLAKFKIV